MNNSLQMQLQELIKSSGNISLKAVGKDIGYSPSVLSQWLNNKYGGNITDVENKIKSYIELHAQRLTYKSFHPVFVPIKNSKVVWGVCNRASMDHKIFLVTGESGSSKTFSLTEYAHKFPNVVLIETDPTFNTKILLSILNKALGYSGHGTKYSMLNECIGHLTGSHKLIIIDEADRLGYDSLETMRRLHDKSGVGIVLAGDPKLVENIRGSKGQFAQLYTRISGHAQLQLLEESEGVSIITSVMPEATKDVIKRIWEMCRRNCRTLRDLLYNTITISSAEGKDVTPALVEKVAASLVV